MMLSAADAERHGQFKTYLEDRYTANRSDEYPADTTRVLSQLNNFRGVVIPRSRDRYRPPPQNAGEDDERVNFAQVGDSADAEGEGAGERQQGAIFLQGRRSSQPRPKPKSYAEAVTTRQQAGEGPDKAKEKAKEVKQASPHGAPDPRCLHCGGIHDLVDCPDLSDDQLGQILI